MNKLNFPYFIINKYNKKKSAEGDLFNIRIPNLIKLY